MIAFDYHIPLKRRRLRGDLIPAFNIFHGRLYFPQAELNEAPAERNLRGHDIKMRHLSLVRKASRTVEQSP